MLDAQIVLHTTGEGYYICETKQILKKFNLKCKVMGQ